MSDEDDSTLQLAPQFDQFVFKIDAELHVQLDVVDENKDEVITEEGGEL